MVTTDQHDDIITLVTNDHYSVKHNKFTSIAPMLFDMFFYWLSGSSHSVTKRRQ